MTKPDRREILSRVAAGTLAAEEAASQLDAIDAEERQPESSIRKVRIARHLGAFEVIGDPSVKEAVADGQHQVRIDGDTMVFEGWPSGGPGRFVFALGRNLANDRLVLRMNPALALDVQVQAGDCQVRGVQGPIHAEVQAGSASIEGFASTIDFSVRAGDLRASGCLDGGDSRIACQAGSVLLHLERGSSVRIKPRSSLGDIELPKTANATDAAGTGEVVIGGGAGSLAIHSTIGSVRVTSE